MCVLPLLVAQEGEQGRERTREELLPGLLVPPGRAAPPAPFPLTGGSAPPLSEAHMVCPSAQMLMERMLHPFGTCAGFPLFLYWKLFLAAQDAASRFPLSSLNCCPLACGKEKLPVIGRKLAEENCRKDCSNHWNHPVFVLASPLLSLSPSHELLRHAALPSFIPTSSASLACSAPPHSALSCCTPMVTSTAARRRGSVRAHTHSHKDRTA